MLTIGTARCSLSLSLCDNVILLAVTLLLFIVVFLGDMVNVMLLAVTPLLFIVVYFGDMVNVMLRVTDTLYVRAMVLV
jgi:hypothetical protein